MLGWNKVPTKVEKIINSRMGVGGIDKLTEKSLIYLRFVSAHKNQLIDFYRYLFFKTEQKIKNSLIFWLTCQYPDQWSNHRIHGYSNRQEMSYSTAPCWLSLSWNGQALYFLNQQLQISGQDHCWYLQGPLAGRIIFQMDKAKLENKILHRHQQECCHDADMDRIMCLSTIGLYQVSIKTEEKYATNITIIAAQFIWKKRPPRIITGWPTSQQTTRY